MPAVPYGRSLALGGEFEWPGHHYLGVKGDDVVQRRVIDLDVKSVVAVLAIATALLARNRGAHSRRQSRLHSPLEPLCQLAAAGTESYPTFDGGGVVTTEDRNIVVDRDNHTAVHLDLGGCRLVRDNDQRSE